MRRRWRHCYSRGAGAFAHVYLAETGDGEQAVLKRVVVPDEEKLLPVMREIQVMVGRTRQNAGRRSWETLTA